jgi:hypothetical protein
LRRLQPIFFGLGIVLFAEGARQHLLEVLTERKRRGAEGFLVRVAPFTDSRLGVVADANRIGDRFSIIDDFREGGGDRRRFQDVANTGKPFFASSATVLYGVERADSRLASLSVSAPNPHFSN